MAESRRDKAASMKSSLCMSDEKALELVQLYKTEECLYNSGIDDYRRKNKRRAAAERIAQKLNLPSFLAKHVMIKLKNLRNSYCQELKKISASVRNGDDPVYKPKVIYFSYMDSFLRPHLQAPRRKGGLPTLVINGGVIKREPEAEHVEDSDEMWELNDSEDPPQADLKFEEGSECEFSSSHLEQEDSIIVGSYSGPKSPPAKRARREDCEPPALRPSGPATSKPPDLLDNFGTYVASLLRSLPPEKSFALQPKIVGLIASCMMESKDDTI